MRSEYAIVLYFDDKTNAILQDLIDKIAEATGNSYMTDNRIPPHITIGDLFGEQKPDISKLAKEIKSAEITFDSIGCFEPYVFYIAPKMNGYLKSCNITSDEYIKASGHEENELYSPDNWQPHITLATKLNSEQLQRAFSLTVPTAFVGRTEEIALVKCNPYREIDRYFL